MKLSMFNIISKDDKSENYIIFNTHTTACLTLNSQYHKKIFVEKDFSFDKEANEILLANGFVVDDNVDELQKIYDIRKSVMSQNIQNIVILTTTNCNARCYYCFEHGIKPIDMTIETAEALIEFCKKKYKDKRILVSWFGGEPLLRFDIIEYVTNRLIEEGYELDGYVTTNGSLITDKMIDFFTNKYESIAFQITLDDIGDGYGKIKRYVDISIPEAFKRTINNIKLLLEQKIKVLIRVNFLVSNISSAKEIYKKVIHLFDGYDMSNTNVYMAPLSTEAQSENLCNCEGYSTHPFLEMVEIHKSEKNTLQNFHSSNDESLLSRYNLSPLPIPCGMMMPSKIVVNANGDLYKCHRLVGKTEFSVGNVFDGYDEKSNSIDLFEAIEITDLDCKKCNIFPICQGGCKYMRLVYGDSQKCCRIKQVKEELVRMYYNDLRNHLERKEEQ